MGINGLLPFLKKASREVNVRNFSGATVAVDAYCWLHKGAFSCAEKLGKGEKTDGYVQFCIKMVNSLLAAGVIPILVFDGCHLPLKSDTDRRRREMKSKNRMLAKNHLLEGKLREARECFQRCVEITSQMALQAIQACRKLGVDCIVAPYEADAQLAYLTKIGIAQIVITEDSDLVLFGCDRILYKMDTNGNGILVESGKLHLCLGIQAENFTFDKFRHMCILSGCDYLASLPGIGLGKSCKFFSKATNPDLNAILPKIPSFLKMPNLVVSAEYKIGFVQADNTFLYQLVFDPVQRKLVPLNSYPPDLNPETLDYAGKRLENNVAYHIALGNIDVDTMEVVDNFDPQVDLVVSKTNSWSSKATKVSNSIWSKKYSQRNTIVIQEKVVPLKASKSPLRSSKSPRIVTQKRTFYEPKLETCELSDNDLVAIYGNAKRTKIDSDEVDPPSPITHCRYFTGPTEVPADEDVVPNGRISSHVSEITGDDQSPEAGSNSQQQRLPPESAIESMEDITSMTLEALHRETRAERISPAENERVSAATTPRGRLLFDRAMIARTHLSSVESNSAKAPSSRGNFSGQGKSVRSLYEFRYIAGDRSIPFEKSPSNHTDFKSVVASTQPKTPSCSFNSFSEDVVSPFGSQDDSEFASSLKCSLPSTSPSSSGRENSTDQVSTPKSFSLVLPAVTRINKTKSLPNKCRVPGLTRHRLTTSQSAASTPKSKQLSLKESLARFTYQKTRP